MLEGEETKARLENLQPWPNKGCELGGLGGGHSVDQLPLPTTQPGVYGGGRCTNVIVNQEGCTTNPLESDNYRQVQSHKSEVTTDPDSNGFVIHPS